MSNVSRWFSQVLWVQREWDLEALVPRMALLDICERRCGLPVALWTFPRMRGKDTAPSMDRVKAPCQDQTHSIFLQFWDHTHRVFLQFRDM